MRLARWLALALVLSVTLAVLPAAEAKDRFGVFVSPYGSSFYYRTGNFSFGFGAPSYYYRPAYYYSAPPAYYYSAPPTYHYSPPPVYYQRPVYYPPTTPTYQTYGYNPSADYYGSREYGYGRHSYGYANPYSYGTHHGYHYSPEWGWHGGTHYGQD